jgi:hypothetical protein
MGAVFRPKDLARGNRKVIDNAIKDFTQILKIMSTSCWVLRKERNQKKN